MELSRAPKPDCLASCPLVSNWSGNVTWEGSYEARVTSEADLVAVMRFAQSQCPKLRIRIAGSRRSYSPIALGDCLGNGETVLISTSAFNRVTVHPHERLVVAEPGATLHSINEELMKCDLALESTSALGEESIAGAVSTGTHGSGLAVGNIASLCVGLRIVKVDGDVVELTAERNNNEFNAACVSMGALGVLSQLTLRAVPLYFLNKHTRTIQRAKLHEQLPTLFNNKETRLTWFLAPHSDEVKIFIRTPADASLKQSGRGCWPDDDGSVCVTNPVVDVSFKAMSFPPGSFKTLQTEAEFFVELQDHHNLVQEVLSFIDSDDVPSSMRADVSVIFRYVRGDQLWLSPAFGSDRVACTLVVRGSSESCADAQLFASLRAGFESAVSKCSRVRPHWAKCHSFRCADLERVYPMWEAFRRIRLSYDPEGLLLSSYLQELLGDATLHSPSHKRKRST